MLLLTKRLFIYYKSSLCNSKPMLRKARDSASLAIQGTFPRLVSGGYAAPIPPLYGSLSDSLANAAGTFYLLHFTFIRIPVHAWLWLPGGSRLCWLR